MKYIDVDTLNNIALKIRQIIFAICVNAGGAHIGPALSIVELLVVLYWEILDINDITSIKRDRFILSKGHGCAALYAVLKEKGFLHKKELKNFCKIEGILGGHPDYRLIKGIEASTGSLGHGICMGVGMAYVLLKSPSRVYVILGDGECQEGSVWESFMAASQLKLNNLCVIIDYNKLQGMGNVKNINDLEPLSSKMTSFGWEVKEVDGHNLVDIYKALSDFKNNYYSNKPFCLIAHTIKGKGISYMENKAIWHYRLPNDEEINCACKELKINNLNEIL